MTKITEKVWKSEDLKTYEGFCNGKNYNGTMYISGLKANNGYVVINGEVSCKKSVAIAVKDIVKIENKQITNANKSLPTSVDGWMKMMERAEKQA